MGDYGIFKRFQIIEEKQVSKTGDPQSNEDIIYVGDNYIAVMDGATKTAKGAAIERTGGQLCAEAAVKALERMSGKESAEEAMKLICEEISAMEKALSLSQQGVHCCACAAIYNGLRHEVWLVGDCHIIVNNEIISTTKRIDAVFGEVRAILIHALLKGGKSEEELLEHDVSRELILPLIDHQRTLENAADVYGYAVLNGKQPPAEVRVINIEPSDEIVFATDGYPVIYPTLKESEEKLMDIITNDPLCYKTICATKGVTRGNISYDDRSYLRFKVVE